MVFKKLQRSNFGKKQIVIEDISRELIPITGRNSFALVLHNVLSPGECAALIRRTEDRAYDDALVEGSNGKQVLRQDIRSCGRCIIDDAGLADAIYERLSNAVLGTEHEKKMMHAPWITASGNLSDSEEITAVGLNERLRFLKYGQGNFFAPHQDLRFVRAPECGEKAGETSYITVQLYLNDKFKGGATRFLCGKRHYDVRPKVGSVLIFDHDILHEGSKVTGGIKYSMRSDIMFSTKGSSTLSQMKLPEKQKQEATQAVGSAPLPWCVQ